MLKRVAVFVAALAALVGGPLGLGRALAGQDLTAMTNADRVSRGLRALSTAGDLQSLAQQRADQMARSGQLAHTTNLGSKVSGWQRLGENVGRGPSLQDIETAFMNSPSHRENILDPTFTQVGAGVTWDGKQYFWVAVIFRQPSGTAAASTPAPPEPPAPRAAATPKTAPKPAPTTTTRPPTTTTTVPPTTTTTAPRPIYTNQDFLAANFADTMASVPASAVHPTPHHPLPTPVVVAGFAAAFGAGGLSGGTAVLRRARVRPRPTRLP